MRRLPIYFLIDISESMVGDQIQQVEEGMATIIKAIKTDPYAIETVWISIIVFAGQAKTLVPLQEVVSFYPPKFPIGGGTSLSKGLGHLMFQMRKDIVKTTMEQKGDWKPIVFLFTDGVPTDDTKSAIAEWKQNWKRTVNMVAISFGNSTDTRILAELTENVLQFKNAGTEDYNKFFKWVTDSIKTSSISVENNESGFELAKLDGDTLSKIDISKAPATKQYIDNNYVVLSAKCQNTKRPYLMKYRKVVNESGFDGLNLQTQAYRLVGGFQVDQSYYELCEDNGIQQKVNTEELIGAPSCPCCGNQFGLAMCQCQKIHCIGNETMSTCPWCGSTGSYGYGEGGFDVGRAQG
ncbi:TerY-C metal binding domain-containing protein [Pedobacter roseus]|uniref:VWA domain-containing protein n=1 Tax=Pedobacter roseus TaxID=336820 RepID=A0A7G9QJ63_9SPHI|nr:TerY-C metal binding domain-containing protein [Pedobacter roseus]QNN43388.1 VWA domain-containing protein [Pedobacter roseus]